MPIFSRARDYTRFLEALQYYQIGGIKPRFSLYNPKLYTPDSVNKLVDMLCFCLMPNHFHLLVRQNQPNGISRFIGQLSNSYTKYFNTKYHRVGPLFQGEFKAVHIETTEQLLHVSRYIHLNPLVSYLTKDLNTYRWSSYGEYIGSTFSCVCEKQAVLASFPSTTAYEQFVLDQESYGKQLEFIKHQLLDWSSDYTPGVLSSN